MNNSLTKKFNRLIWINRNINNLKNYAKSLEEFKLFGTLAKLGTYIEQSGLQNPEIYKLLGEVYRSFDIGRTIYFQERYMKETTIEIPANEYNMLGLYYNTLFQYYTSDYSIIQKALYNIETACKMEPENSQFNKNAALTAYRAKDYQTCARYYKKLFEIGKITNLDKYDYAAFCFQAGDYAGWRKYFPARFFKEIMPIKYPKIQKPEWDGVVDITDKTLLIHYEQGFGDTFLMWGYLPRLKKLAKHIIFVVPDITYDLLKNNSCQVEVIPESRADLNSLEFDYHIPSMGIPIVLKLEGKDLCIGEGYIKANEKLVKEYKEKYFNNDKLKIGICFSGSIYGDPTRNISPDRLLILEELKDVEIYSLTKYINDDKFNMFRKNKIHNIVKDFNDFNQTAAAIENCDIILTTDNVIMNLSGALGKKTLALFNWYYDWRWFDIKGENITYLTSVKPFVNDKMNNWDYSINAAVAEIRKIQNS